MDVSKNRGTPKSSILIGFCIINHPYWDTGVEKQQLCYSFHEPLQCTNVYSTAPPDVIRCYQVNFAEFDEVLNCSDIFVGSMRTAKPTKTETMYIIYINAYIYIC